MGGATIGDRPASPLTPMLLCLVKRRKGFGLTNGIARRLVVLSVGGALAVSGQLPSPPPLFWLLAKLAELCQSEACLPVGKGREISRRKSAA
ncbi:hypothetical protein StoSoilB3_39860 [Arthrobacter sp. StoSoilB3]|nr:hypothetical protein StoSoilB3_39860 [Arthrobacter sp. StoSoilB3]